MDSPALTVYADGVFDLFHPGHLAFLEKAKGLGGRGAALVVGVITDEDAEWKRKPIMTHSERLAMVRACSLVDRVVEGPPLVVTMAFLRDNGLDLVVHGDDDSQELFFGEPIAAGCMRYVGYTVGISTTAIIERVAARAAAHSDDVPPSSGQ